MKCMAVCAAFPLEVKFISRFIGMPCPSSSKPVVYHRADGKVLALAVSGMGRERMVSVLQQMEPSFGYSWISAGSAGALDPCLSAKECLAGEDVITEGGTVLNTSCPVHFNLPLRKEPLYCHSSVIVSAEEKARFYMQTGAVAVDMESEAVVKHAMSRGEPFVWLKSISDTAKESLPSAILGCIGPDGFPSTGKSLWVMLKQPPLIPAMLRMGYRSNQLSRKLACMLVPYLKDFLET